MEFLYFPEDKSEYIPAAISLFFFVVAAIAAMYFLVKHSKKEEKKWDDKYK
jgi:preprotein translocase subunit YajC